MHSFQCGYSEGLGQIVDSSDKPLAFVLGTRSGDPNSKGQGAFAPSSSYMPQFMRVRCHPPGGFEWKFASTHACR
jgi:hypothetical protein